ncbi:hypothetical protein JCM3766R1_004722 [Sporobolomyces carnicolor]
MQELTDRLVVVVEEEDVLFTLVVLHEMRQLVGCPSQSINALHSWKRYSALGSIARLSQLSALHTMLVHILLLSGAAYGGLEASNCDLANLLAGWEGRGRGQAIDAEQLLSLKLSDAADWIDEHLPLPPNPDQLTGGGSLPSPPLSYGIESIPVATPPRAFLLQFRLVSLGDRNAEAAQSRGNRLE